MTQAQVKGALLFFSKAQCYKCHNGAALGGNGFAALGMNDLDAASPDDSLKKGRGFITGPADDYKFKIPQLYNLHDSPHYGHGASFHTVKDVIKYKNAGIPQNPAVPLASISKDFVPLGLTDQEINDLTDFVENALDDYEMYRHASLVVPSRLCIPNNDPISILDRGCLK
jgi:cytochrome c peroxidase